MIITYKNIRKMIREAILEQVVGYQAPKDAEKDAQNPDYLDDGPVGVSAQQGSQSDVEATGDAVKSLTQQRQSQLDSGSTVDAAETGRELSGVRKRRG